MRRCPDLFILLLPFFLKKLDKLIPWAMSAPADFSSLILIHVADNQDGMYFDRVWKY